MKMQTQEECTNIKDIKWLQDISISEKEKEEFLKEENMSLNEYLQKNCEAMSQEEQKDIEALSIDFDDLNGKSYY